jgi:uncharacterized protein YqgC (DUF456 family)
MVGAAYVLVALLMTVGVIGSIVPFVPGTPLILAGAFVYGVATDFQVIGLWRLVILAIIAALAWTLEHVAGAVGTRRAGGSRYAVVGALAGVAVGLFFPPVGLLVGPMLGAIAGELVRTGHVERSVRSGLGAFIGMLGGAVAHFALAVVMVALFLYWIWRG